jgi:hypothetical protein
MTDQASDVMMTDQSSDVPNSIATGDGEPSSSSRPTGSSLHDTTAIIEESTYTATSKVTIRWLQDALSTKENWASRAGDILTVLEREEITTLVDIREASKQSWEKVTIDDKPLPARILDLIQDKAKATGSGSGSGTFGSAVVEYNQVSQKLWQIEVCFCLFCCFCSFYLSITIYDLDRVLLLVFLTAVCAPVPVRN